MQTCSMNVLLHMLWFDSTIAQLDAAGEGASIPSELIAGRKSASSRPGSPRVCRAVPGQPDIRFRSAVARLPGPCRPADSRPKRDAVRTAADKNGTAQTLLRWNSLQKCGKFVRSLSESWKRPKRGSGRTMFSAGENGDSVKRSVSARAPRPARRWRTLVVPVDDMVGKGPLQPRQQTGDTPHSRMPRGRVRRSWKSRLSRSGLGYAATQRLKASVGPTFAGEGQPAGTPLGRLRLDQTMRGRPAR